MIVDPWNVKGDIDYNKLINEFGTNKITEDIIKKIEKHTGEIHPLIKRRIFFSHRQV